MGIVSSLKPTNTLPAGKLKPISALVRREPVLSPDLLELARWMSAYYACSLEPVLEGMIPASVRGGANEKSIRMIGIPAGGIPSDAFDALSRSPKQKELLDYLSKQGKPVPLNDTLKHLGIGEGAAKGLMAKGLAEESRQAIRRVAYADDLGEPCGGYCTVADTCGGGSRRAGGRGSACAVPLQPTCPAVALVYAPPASTCSARPQRFYSCGSLAIRAGLHTHSS